MKRIMHKFKINEISGVDRPAQKHARVVLMKSDDDAVVTTKANSMTNYNYDTSQDPFHAMLDRQARARQAITGESYAKAFTEVYMAPENIAIKAAAQYEQLAKSHDSLYGTQFSTNPVAKAEQEAPAEIHKIIGKLAIERSNRTGETYAKTYTEIYCDHKYVAARNDVAEPLQKAAEMAEHLGPAHAKMHSLAIDHQRLTGSSYASAYAYAYGRRENEGLRNKVRAEHLRATMSQVGD
jgi:hypothetical protein